MEDDPTKDLTDSEKLDRILAELADVKTRLSALEAGSEDRTRETRPKLDLIIKEMSDLREEMAEVHKQLRSMNRKFEIFSDDMLTMKADVKGLDRDFDRRLTELERKPN